MLVHRYGNPTHSKVVDNYDLTKIKLDPRFYGMYLVLQDRNTKSAAPLVDLQGDRRVWDLLYNGILHSVASGADINRAAAKWLQLDRVPALYDPTGTGDEVKSGQQGAHAPADSARTEEHESVTADNADDISGSPNDPHTDGDTLTEPPGADVSGDPDVSARDENTAPTANDEGDDADDSKDDKAPASSDRGRDRARGRPGNAPDWVRRVR